MVAGPNGSGKSTLITALRADPRFDLPALYINADDLLREGSLADARADMMCPKTAYVPAIPVLALAPAAITLADQAFVFNNTQRRNRPWFKPAGRVERRTPDTNA
jgi:predicted ABC-type ATPase